MKLSKMICDRCMAQDTKCERCLGIGWMWTDTRPATYCPGGGTGRPLVNAYLARLQAEGVLPCARGGDRCPGCNRAVASIGSAEDVTRTRIMLAAVRAAKKVPVLRG